MKKVFLFIALAALFCFSFSALAEPARQAGVTVAAVNQPGDRAEFIKIRSDQTARPAESRKRPAEVPRIFENHTPATANNMAYG